MSIRNAAKTFAQGFVILTIGPVMLAVIIPVSLLTIGCWREDNQGYPVPPAIISAPLACLFGTW
jgi:hypothetical protein